MEYLKAEMSELRAENERLEKEARKLQAENRKLQEENRKLREQLAKNSSNSSKPPSSDGLRKPKPKPKNLRGNTQSVKREGGVVTKEQPSRLRHVAASRRGAWRYPTGLKRGEICQKPTFKGATEPVEACGRDQIIQEARKAHPDPVPTPGKKGKPKGTKESNLLKRLEVYKEETLRFANDFRIPFDNIQAKRDIRMTKIKQKISGCFRSEEGAKQWTRIRAYISTARKKGLNVIDSLASAFSGPTTIPIRV